MIRTLRIVDEAALGEIAEEMEVRKTKEVFLLFALGSQFDHLIKMALEKLGVFCLVADPGTVGAEDVRKVSPTGIILSGGPASVYAEAPPFDTAIFDLKIPLLGICLGFQLWAQHIGCVVKPAEKREFGTHPLSFSFSSRLLEGCENGMPVLESHGDVVTPYNELANFKKGFRVLAATENSPVAAGQYKHLWGVQFHPEVTETTFGQQIFENFCFGICGAKDRYPAQEVARQKIFALGKTIGDEKVLAALSGGSDSSVMIYILKHALGGKPGRLRAVYIRGLDRPDDEAHVRKFFGNLDWLELVIIDATDRILEALRGKITMYDKRMAFRPLYKAVLEEQARVFGAGFIAQGTIYTDVCESGGGYETRAEKAVIKPHHNPNLGFSLPELMPLADCVKDTARNIGRVIGVPEELLRRHPFPGPGIAVRVEGEIDADKLRVARQIDGIWIEELHNWGLYHTVWQAGAVITSSTATGTKGDDAVSGWVVVLWAVWSVNGFTARWARLPDDFLDHVSRRITNEVREVVSVEYRISNKPPSTIEWG